MHLFPGDSVKTRTLDSRGHDRDGKPRAPRGNPLTGPFYVEGAMPGDTLVVHLDRVRTNRDTAYQSNLVATTALETGAVQDQAKYENGFHSLEDRCRVRNRFGDRCGWQACAFHDQAFAHAGLRGRGAAA